MFIPKPFRAFAFVTFVDGQVAQGLCGQDHVVAGNSVHVSTASPKSRDRHGNDISNNGGRGGMMNSRGDNNGGGGGGNGNNGGVMPYNNNGFNNSQVCTMWEEQ